MKYISVSEMAKRWGISERTVRNYCAQGKIEDAFLRSACVIMLFHLL
ncbi:helix-turn-helix domain-containing protein [Aequitasia blattaphilus]